MTKEEFEKTRKLVDEGHRITGRIAEVRGMLATLDDPRIPLTPMFAHGGVTGYRSVTMDNTIIARLRDDVRKLFEAEIAKLEAEFAAL